MGGGRGGEGEGERGERGEGETERGVRGKCQGAKVPSRAGYRVYVRQNVGEWVTDRRRASMDTQYLYSLWITPPHHHTSLHPTPLPPPQSQPVITCHNLHLHPSHFSPPLPTAHASSPLPTPLPTTLPPPPPHPPSISAAQSHMHNRTPGGTEQPGCSSCHPHPPRRFRAHTSRSTL